MPQTIPAPKTTPSNIEYTATIGNIDLEKAKKTITLLGISQPGGLRAEGVHPFFEPSHLVAYLTMYKGMTFAGDHIIMIGDTLQKWATPTLVPDTHPILTESWLRDALKDLKLDATPKEMAFHLAEKYLPFVTTMGDTYINNFLDYVKNKNISLPPYKIIRWENRFDFNGYQEQRIRVDEKFDSDEKVREKTYNTAKKYLLPKQSKKHNKKQANIDQFRANLKAIRPQLFSTTTDKKPDYVDLLFLAGSAEYAKEEYTLLLLLMLANNAPGTNNQDNKKFEFHYRSDQVGEMFDDVLLTKTKKSDKPKKMAPANLESKELSSPTTKPMQKLKLKVVYFTSVEISNEEKQTKKTNGRSGIIQVPSDLDSTIISLETEIAPRIQIEPSLSDVKLLHSPQQVETNTNLKKTSYSQLSELTLSSEEKNPKKQKLEPIILKEEKYPSSESEKDLPKLKKESSLASLLNFFNNKIPNQSGLNNSEQKAPIPMPDNATKVALLSSPTTGEMITNFFFFMHGDKELAKQYLKAIPEVNKVSRKTIVGLS